MSRLLTPAEIEALRAAPEPFIPAPTETYLVTAELGMAELSAAELDALEPGSVVPLRPEREGLVTLVANAVVVGYGRVEEKDGVVSVRVMSLPPQGKGGGR